MKMEENKLKIYMIILDGAADRKIKMLNNKTPLEYATTPGLSKLASNGSECMIDVIGDNIIPESDSGAMALLSYDPQIYYPGRGTLEGIGTGFIPKGYSYAAFRVNFASYDSNRDILDRRTARGLDDEELQQLAKAINENVDLKKYKVKFKLMAFGHHRGILCFYSNDILLSGNVSNTDPGFKKQGVWGIPVNNYAKRPLKCKELDDSEESKITAQIVNDFEIQSNKILMNHPVNIERVKSGKLPSNYLIIRDGGSTPKSMPSFEEKFSKKLVMYGQLPAEKAIAELINQRFEYSKSLDLQLDKEFLKTAEKRLKQENADVVFIHIKGPDEPGHDNEPLKKVEAIEMIDKYFIQNLIKDLEIDDIVIVTCDHATPCELKVHSNDKVPLLISGNLIKKDGSNKYDENTAYKGKLNLKKGIEILPYVESIILGKEK